MKTLILALALTTATSAFAYTPKFEASVTADDTITLSIDNQDAAERECTYSMSWLENMLEYKRISGTVVLAEGQYLEINVTKDIAANVTLLKARLNCN